MSVAVEQNEEIDILEQDIQDISPFLLKILLEDKTTGKFIRFACDEYLKYGEAYAADKEIYPELIIGNNTKIIQPRTAKSKDEQINRTRKAAEVFTPSWICNEMNNHCDEQWFGRPNVFNTPNGHDWTPNPEPITFPEDGKNKRAGWMKYVDSKRLEITCGEAPYLVSRYDTTTGEFLPIVKRIGILDRKLRIVNENTNNETDWYKWAKRAFESTYGYEYQGDNLLLARENLLWTFIDYYQQRFGIEPTLVQKKQIANVIAWNVWQMDGLNDTVPFATSEENDNQLELFDDLPKIYTPMLCKMKDWRSKEIFYFQDLKKGTKNEI
ncbi:MAG: restriction endonuclease subunit M [Alphaproteobacteria bacterium]|nr:restriction endonuclease subunit M [Alphaproteobacteria bacterium]